MFWCTHRVCVCVCVCVCVNVYCSNGRRSRKSFTNAQYFDISVKFKAITLNKVYLALVTITWISAARFAYWRWSWSSVVAQLVLEVIVELCVVCQLSKGFIIIPCWVTADGQKCSTCYRGRSLHVELLARIVTLICILSIFFNHLRTCYLSPASIWRLKTTLMVLLS